MIEEGKKHIIQTHLRVVIDGLQQIISLSLCILYHSDLIYPFVKFKYQCKSIIKIISYILKCEKNVKDNFIKVSLSNFLVLTSALEIPNRNDIANAVYITRYRRKDKIRAKPLITCTLNNSTRGIKSTLIKYSFYESCFPGPAEIYVGTFPYPYCISQQFNALNRFNLNYACLPFSWRLLSSEDYFHLIPLKRKLLKSRKFENKNGTRSQQPSLDFLK